MENINTTNTGITTYYESMYSHVPVYRSTKDNAKLAPKYIHQLAGDERYMSVASTIYNQTVSMQQNAG